MIYDERNRATGRTTRIILKAVLSASELALEDDDTWVELCDHWDSPPTQSNRCRVFESCREVAQVLGIPIEWKDSQGSYFIRLKRC